MVGVGRAFSEIPAGGNPRAKVWDSAASAVTTGYRVAWVPKKKVEGDG